jgi:serine/threonine protein kinase
VVGATPPPPVKLQVKKNVAYPTGELLPTQVVAERYVILAKIAQGGMGAIYRAQDKRLPDKVVALKEMTEVAIDPGERQGVLESFNREAELLARLNHPALVKVTDRFQEGERHYMVMEFIDGETLESLLKKQPVCFPEERVLLWAEQLCNLLSYLHMQNPPIIYRDIKPANIMVVAGTDTVKLIDFGIARLYKPGQRKDTIQFGTEGYAPPEQFGKAQTDARADVFALGVTLHELLTGHDPSTQLFSFPPVRQLSPTVSKRVEAAIAKCVEINKDNRPQSMADMWEVLSGDRPTWFHLPTGQQPSGAQASSRIPPGSSQGSPASSAVGPNHSGASGAQGTWPQASLQFGRVIAGQQRHVSRTIELPQGEEAELSADANWLRVHPKAVDQSGGKVTVILDINRLKTSRHQVSGGRFQSWLNWHTSRLVPAEQAYQSTITAERQSGQEERILVSVTVSPPGWRVLMGWMLTTGAMFTEFGVVLYVVLALLAG